MSLKQIGDEYMKKSTIIILICVAMLLGMLFGILASIIDRNNMQQAQVNEIIKANELMNSNAVNTTFSDVIETNSQDIKLSPDAYIIFEKHYINCGHTIIEKEKVEQAEVNKDEEYFKNAYSDWTIKEFSADEVRLYKEFQGNCDEHYLITVKDDYIAVYSVDDEGNKTLKEETDIPVQYLPEEDVELLKKGITAYGQNELARKLEDYE